LTKELHNRAAGLTNVHFLGRVPDEDLGNYFKACTVLAFPSITKNEAFGVVLAEAMYCGAVPVTFTIDCSGVNWVSIGNETGIEVPNRDLQEYTKALTTLLENDELRATYSCAAQKRVKSMFLPDIATATLYDIYNNL
jgi:glycosyltransferase involved in cell wall biosynthesis